MIVIKVKYKIKNLIAISKKSLDMILDNSVI